MGEKMEQLREGFLSFMTQRFSEAFRQWAGIGYPMDK